MSFYSIGNALKTILDTVKVGSTILADVFNYDSPDANTGYPYACVVLKEGDEEALDTFNNAANYRFFIRAVDVNKDKAAMEQTMRQLCDEIMAELRKAGHQTLGGTVDRVQPFKISWGWQTQQDLPSRFFEIEIEVMKDISTQ